MSIILYHTELFHCLKIPLCSSYSSFPQPKPSELLILPSPVLPLLECYIIGISTVCSFSPWLISLIHNWVSSIIFLWVDSWIVFHCPDVPHLLFSFTCQRAFLLLPSFGIMNKAPINIHVQVLWGYKFSSPLGRYQGVWLLDHMINKCLLL